jgi:uncharacterized protein GlcG (DUF336 family)
MNHVISRVVPGAHVSRETGEVLIAAALGAAQDAHFDISVAVVDAGGTLRCFARSDGALPMTADVSIGKAWTAATSGFATHIWNEIVSDPRVAPLVQLPGMIAVSGGYPIVDDGRVVGAIGVSGGVDDQDLQIAVTALVAAGFPASIES